MPALPGYEGNYTIAFDPLDGSSNVDVNVSVGTIFSIHRRLSPPGGPGVEADLLQPGSRQVVAGYIVYGSSTMIVYTSGAGVHGFTLDPSLKFEHRDGFQIVFLTHEEWIWYVLLLADQ